MGAPFANTWNGVTEAYFTGAGSFGMTVWLLIAIALCIIPLFVAHGHETKAYKRMDKK